MRPSVRRACDRDGVKGHAGTRGRRKTMRADIQDAGTGSALEQRLAARGRGCGFPESLIVDALQPIEIHRINDAPRSPHS